MSESIPQVVTPMAVRDCLDALITVYVDGYILEVEQAPCDAAYQSRFENLARRAVKAHEAIIKHPDLFQEIYEDFRPQFKQYRQEIFEVIADR
ncbi:hypothetical protein [Siphonobacter sp.]|uniref:hypothetical protein n=1 Tax=Siphonobacter sp. TaxID=1869184 RepID=UPI003B3BA5D5